MDELDRLKTFTETRIKNKETVLQAKKDAWDREEKLDKSLDGLELEDKLERQFEADLEQVKELGGVINRRMLKEAYQIDREEGEEKEEDKEDKEDKEEEESRS